MSERLRISELSEQFVTDRVYFNFIRLAQMYGEKPAIATVKKFDSQKTSALADDTKTLTVDEIPSDNPNQSYPDSISGIDWGGRNNVIEIFYQKGEQGIKVYITKGSRSHRTKMHTITVFKKQPFGNSKENNAFSLADENSTKPSVYDIDRLLQKAETTLRIKEEERLKERFDKPKTTIGQRLARRLGSILYSE